MEEREHAKELSGDFKEDKEKAGLEGRSDVRSVPKGEEGRGRARKSDEEREERAGRKSGKKRNVRFSKTDLRFVHM